MRRQKIQKIAKIFIKRTCCTFTKFSYCDNVKLSNTGGSFVWTM
nr:MAG TPA: hypothetical protein [Bacteriophage sp.]DAW65966.1 MAG TPA: hypothetical protein [Bacteriophage sp.]